MGTVKSIYEKVEQYRYVLRKGKKDRNCMMCAFYYKEKLCRKWQWKCGEDGIFLDVGGDEGSRNSGYRPLTRIE